MWMYFAFEELFRLLIHDRHTLLAISNKRFTCFAEKMHCIKHLETKGKKYSLCIREKQITKGVFLKGNRF